MLEPTGRIRSWLRGIREICEALFPRARRPAEGEVLFRSGPAGILGSPVSEDEPCTYRFMPYRSATHLWLGEALRHGPAKVQIVLGRKRLARRVVRMGAREIVLDDAVQRQATRGAATEETVLGSGEVR